MKDAKPKKKEEKNRNLRDTRRGKNSKGATDCSLFTHRRRLWARQRTRRIRGLRSQRKVEVFRVSGICEVRRALNANLVVVAHDCVTISGSVAFLCVSGSPRVICTSHAEDKRFRLKSTLILIMVCMIGKVDSKPSRTY